jgi:type IV secretory pathway VirD2 relaxase
MASEDPFEPRLGKMRAQPPKAPKSFKAKVVRAAMRAGAFKRVGLGAASGRVSASKFGRGNGVARVVSASPKSAAHTRRVVVKARFVKLAGPGRKAAMAHLSYIQRDGVTREGAPGVMYDKDQDVVDRQTFIDRAEGDRHQFRFIVAPENGDQYEDLKPLTRRLMAQAEQDLGTGLDWVAVDHHNTGHPHTHIIVRGKADDGKDLVIAREYLSQGFRHRAEELVTLDLGPRSDLEISTERRIEIHQGRFTSIDRQLVRDADADGNVRAGHRDPEINALRAGRLTHLAEQGLAENLGDGQWRLKPNIEATLRDMAVRGDIIKTLHLELKRRRMEHAAPDSVVHGIADPMQPQTPITGRLLKRGLSDEHGDRHYLMIEATDGRVHYVDIGQGDRIEPLGREAIIQVTPRVPALKPADQTIVAVAATNNGEYDIDAHLKHDRNASQAFAETHVRRLEAIRKTIAGVEREPDGTFRIGPDYLDKALAYEQRDVRLSPAKVEVLSPLSLDSQIKRQAVTWLDRELVGGDPSRYAHAGFGQESRLALMQRQQWLVDEGLAQASADGQVRVTEKALAALNRREIVATSNDLSRQFGLPYTEARTGDLVEGTLRQSVTLGSGKYAVVERARDFTLVPWRDVLARHIDKSVSGMVREGGINWQIGRNRGLSID